MSPAELENVIFETVLTKAWKSQAWMKAMHCLPFEFTIFCWLPFMPPEGTGDKTQQLIDELRREGWPFHLRVKVPPNPSDLFPAKFAFQSAGRMGGAEGRLLRTEKLMAETVSTVDPTDFLDEEHEDFFPEWDIFSDDPYSAR